MTGFVDAVRRANAPRPPEPSVRLRVAAVASVTVGLAAAAAQHEISVPAASLSALLVWTGTAFSHRTRTRSLNSVKIAVAVGALAATVWFVARISGGPVGDITGVEDPLTVLFAWMLAVHSFHVPARRDLVFSLAGSAALVAVAAAQAIEMGFGLYALAWAAAALWTLLEAGASAARARPGLWWVGASAAAVAVLGLVAWLLLPAPTPGFRLDFRPAAGTAGPVPKSGALAGDSGSPLQLSRPGQATGPARVGGYLGFAGDLNTALRAKLSKKVVMEVRATVPSFWIGETFDHWSGRTWSSTVTDSTVLDGGSPFSLPPAPGAVGRPGTTDLQTFYIEDATADLVFHADNAERLWLASPRVYVGRDGSIVSPMGMGKGAIYSVESTVSVPTPAELSAAPVPHGSSIYTQLPGHYANVARLAARITAGDRNEFDAIQSLIAWIGAHTRYSTDIPPLPPGADAVEQFLFGNRTGYCEQISTALAVMLRTLGIPTREAVGYVPGPYNPVTDLYEVRAEDAHAWVQAYFPGYGWVSFDPTAAVPDANPSPGGTALRIAGRFLAGLPWPLLSPAGAGAAGLAGGLVLYRRRRARRRLTPAQAAAVAMERAGRRAGRARAPSQTLTEFAAALQGGWPDVARAADAAAYGGVDLPPERWRELLRAAQAVQQ